MKKFLMFLAGLAMTCSLSSCFGPDMFYDPFGPEVIVVHDGPHHGPHHPAPHHDPHHPAPHHHYEGHGYRW